MRTSTLKSIQAKRSAPKISTQLFWETVYSTVFDFQLVKQLCAPWLTMFCRAWGSVMSILWPIFLYPYDCFHCFHDKCPKKGSTLYPWIEKQVLEHSTQCCSMTELTVSYFDILEIQHSRCRVCWAICHMSKISQKNSSGVTVPSKAVQLSEHWAKQDIVLQATAQKWVILLCTALISSYNKLMSSHL